MARRITDIVIHCSATPEGRDVSAAEIRGWHKRQGWADIGYHHVVRLDGSVEPGRPESQPGAHVAGNNARSIGVVYAGGLARDGRTPKDTRTPAQRATLKRLVIELRSRYPGARIRGHRDFPGVAKACPSFDVAAWLHEEGLA
jgi:N-acetylmuramoyl-L-alanine amidase